MISRSTLIAALVVVELAIVGLAGSAIGAGHMIAGPAPFAFTAPVGSVPNVAGVRLNRTFVTGPVPRVQIDVPDVSVTVESGPALSVRVEESVALHGLITGRPAPLAAVQTPEGVRIYATGENGVHFMLGTESHTLRVVVPPAARVELATRGSIDVSGLRAKLIAHTSDGWLHVRDHQGDLDVSTDDGRIELVDVSGSAIDAIDHDGRIYLTRVGADRLVAHSDSGRIVGTGVRAVDGGLTTLDGRIVVSFTTTSNATAVVHTDDGAIRVSGFTSLDTGTNRRTVTLGDGRGHFEISTADGPITITQGANG
jgi:hypothetical protein